ncbi:hypothetical protein QF027_000126 [Streptomyces canus]|nr:hypothetical protein [Streptomyces canus]
MGCTGIARGGGVCWLTRERVELRQCRRAGPQGSWQLALRSYARSSSTSGLPLRDRSPGPRVGWESGTRGGLLRSAPASRRRLRRRPGADDELYGALLYLEAHAGALKEQTARRTAALTGVTLWEYIREQADIHQAAAVEAARAARVEWTDLAPALAVKSASAAYNKAARLRAAVLSDLSPDGAPTVPVRRTPEAVLAAERHAAQRAAEERRAQEHAARRHSLIAPVAQRLLDHRDGRHPGHVGILRLFMQYAEFGDKACRVEAADPYGRPDQGFCRGGGPSCGAWHGTVPKTAKGHNSTTFTGNAQDPKPWPRP